ncbi:MAG: PKD domain-containing protein, partial [Gemmatimonadales bacterium]
PANQPPTASFSWLATDLSVLFTDGSSDPDGTVTSWDWSFGDGGSSTEQNPTHTYAAAGDYTVTLTVTDDQGAADTFSDVATTSEPPAGVIVSAILPNSIAEGRSIDVTITGSGFALGATVTFENGTGPAPYATVLMVDENAISATVTVKNGGPPRNRLWDVRVSNPAGSSGVLVGGLTVTSN